MAHAVPCTEWNPALAVDLVTGHESMAYSDDGSAQAVRMFAHFGSMDDHSVWSMDSTNEEGTDFGLTCTVGGGCDQDGDTCPYGSKCDFEDDSSDDGEAVEELCSDGTSACDYQTDAAHGRILWDYVAYGGVNDSVDEPKLVFSGNRDSTTCTSSDFGFPRTDIYTAEWDGAEFQAATSGSCPVPTIADAHDPAMLPLPFDTFKMYYHYQAEAFHVVHWDGTAWVHDREIEIAFDDSTTLGTVPTSPSLGQCLGNMDALILPSEGGGDTGAFFKARNVTDPGAVTCFGSLLGIVFAELRN